MLILILGIVIFLGVHTLTAFRETRAGLIERFGLRTYKGAYSLVAAIGLALIIYGFIRYRAEGMIQIWAPPEWTHYLAPPLVWFAFVAFAARRAPPGRIRGALRHPMLVAIKSWALAHLLVNGDLASAVLFGGFLAWAVVDRISEKKRLAAGRTKNPVAGPVSRDIIAVVAGIVAYVLFVLYLHEWLIGVPPIQGVSA